MPLAAAKKVYSNYLKGNPPLKPIKGNHGYVSWLAGEGSPNSGRNEGVVIPLSYTPDPKLDKTIKSSEVAARHKKELEVAQQTSHLNPNSLANYRTWVGLGQTAEGEQGVTTIKVPQHEILNPAPHTAGSFLTVGEKAKHRLTLSQSQVEELKRNLEEKEEGAVTAVEQKIQQRELERNKPFTVSKAWGPKIPPLDEGWTQEILPDKSVRLQAPTYVAAKRMARSLASTGHKVTPHESWGENWKTPKKGTGGYQ